MATGSSTSLNSQADNPRYNAVSEIGLALEANQSRTRTDLRRFEDAPLPPPARSPSPEGRFYVDGIDTEPILPAAPPPPPSLPSAAELAQQSSAVPSYYSMHMDTTTSRTTAAPATAALAAPFSNASYHHHGTPQHDDHHDDNDDEQHEDDEHDEDQHAAAEPTHAEWQQQLLQRVKDEENMEKREMLLLFHEKEQQEGVKIPKAFNMQSDLNEMRWWYYKLIRDGRIKDEVDSIKNWIVNGSHMVLMANTAIGNPLNLRLKEFPKEIRRKLNTDWHRHLCEYVKSRCGISGPKQNPLRYMLFDGLHTVINYHRNQLALEEQQRKQQQQQQQPLPASHDPEYAEFLQWRHNRGAAPPSLHRAAPPPTFASDRQVLRNVLARADPARDVPAFMQPPRTAPSHFPRPALATAGSSVGASPFAPATTSPSSARRSSPSTSYPYQEQPIMATSSSAPPPPAFRPPPAAQAKSPLRHLPPPPPRPAPTISHVAERSRQRMTTSSASTASTAGTASTAASDTERREINVSRGRGVAHPPPPQPPPTTTGSDTSSSSSASASGGRLVPLPWGDAPRTGGPPLPVQVRDPRSATPPATVRTPSPPTRKPSPPAKPPAARKPSPPTRKPSPPAKPPAARKPSPPAKPTPSEPLADASRQKSVDEMIAELESMGDDDSSIDDDLVAGVNGTPHMAAVANDDKVSEMFTMVDDMMNTSAQVGVQPASNHYDDIDALLDDDDGATLSLGRAAGSVQTRKVVKSTTMRRRGGGAAPAKRKAKTMVFARSSPHATPASTPK